jgi:hypothetical protein
VNGVTIGISLITKYHIYIRYGITLEIPYPTIASLLRALIGTEVPLEGD